MSMQVLWCGNYLDGYLHIFSDTKFPDKVFFKIKSHDIECEADLDIIRTESTVVELIEAVMKTVDEFYMRAVLEDKKLATEMRHVSIH